MWKRGRRRKPSADNHPLPLPGPPVADRTVDIEPLLPALESSRA